jgi:hypothetical protein
MTDIASGWTETAAMVVREQFLVETVEQIRARLPFPMLGLDVDNHSAFINETMLALLPGAGRPLLRQIVSWPTTKYRESRSSTSSYVLRLDPVQLIYRITEAQRSLVGLETPVIVICRLIRV